MSNCKKSTKTKASMNGMDGIHHRRSVRNYMGEVQLTAIHKKATHWDSLPLTVLGVISSVSGKGRNPNT